MICEENPAVTVMILTSFSDKNDVRPALEARAGGYQLKDSDPDKLVEGIHNMIKGEHQLPK